MKYILHSGSNSIDYENYLQALKSYQSSLPKKVLEFASDLTRFELNGASSLHDCWLKELLIEESGSPSQTEVTLRLLGQMHDRIISIKYREVVAYSITRTATDNSPYPNPDQDDLYTHEIRVSDDGHVLHEILFVSDKSILIECKTFDVSEEPT